MDSILTDDGKNAWDILVVGAGVGGLSFAIDAKLKGMNVRVVERRSGFEEYSDIIGLGRQAMQTPTRWPGFLDVLNPRAYQSSGATLHRADGTFIAEWNLSNGDNRARAVTRADLQNALIVYAESLGINVEMSDKVVEYFDSPEQGAGIILSDGRRLTSDIVIAADGARSASRNLIEKSPMPLESSGYSIFRAGFPVKLLEGHPVIAEAWKGEPERVEFLFGKDQHAVYGRDKRTAWWTLTHIDHDPNGHGQADGEVVRKQALGFTEGWSPVLREMIQLTPADSMIDWKLRWRDPTPIWLSENSRVVQMGDSARPYLPTSGSGASMAMEDAFTLSTCVELAGTRSRLETALKTYNKLRFERAIAVVRHGFRNRQLLHHQTGDNAPDINQLLGPGWIVNHDAEKYAYDNFEACARDIETGQSNFVNTNSVPGYTYKPWTVADLLAAEQRGEIVRDEGDWGSEL